MKRNNIMFIVGAFILTIHFSCKTQNQQVIDYFDKKKKKEYDLCLKYSNYKFAIERKETEIADLLMGTCKHEVNEYDYYKKNSLFLIDSLQGKEENFTIYNTTYHTLRTLKPVETILKIENRRCQRIPVADSCMFRIVNRFEWDENKREINVVEKREYLPQGYSNEEIELIQDYFLGKNKELFSETVLALDRYEIIRIRERKLKIYFLSFLWDRYYR